MSIEAHIPRFILFILVLILGDRIPFFSREIRGVWDAFLHGVIALLILLPLCHFWYHYAIAFFSAFLLDVDHFISARSFRLKDAINLSTRPISHSITFAGALGLVLWLIFPETILPLLLFISVTSHVVKDAETGITPILWPLKLRKIPHFFYIIIEILLFIGIVIISSPSNPFNP